MTSDNLFSKDDPFGLPPIEQHPARNGPLEYTVSEISQKLKRTVEDSFSYVRVRGEISKVTIAKSGHLYTSLKDDLAVLDAICWKGTVSRLNIRPEEGLEVICTGKLTTYPGRSNYQMIIESMELAGQGALLKMLEERKKKLAAEGLFDQQRKRPLPFLPERIGVVTSPTGAVIRDILHRLAERFPRHVLVWPVMVQGSGAADQITAAIKGFNDLPATLRPDLLIVARGGGSLEDLMPFNEENVVRAAANSTIPMISAVGHETDTTLIDLAADLRAPTPTAAAEKSVPVRAELLASLNNSKARMENALSRLLEMPEQRLDHLTQRLDRVLNVWIDRKSTALESLNARLTPDRLQMRIQDMLRLLTAMSDRLHRLPSALLQEKQSRLESHSALLESLSFERVLERGFALVTDDLGHSLTSADQARAAKNLSIRFHDGSVKAKKA